MYGKTVESVMKYDKNLARIFYMILVDSEILSATLLEYERI